MVVHRAQPGVSDQVCQRWGIACYVLGPGVSLRGAYNNRIFSGWIKSRRKRLSKYDRRFSYNFLLGSLLCGGHFSLSTLAIAQSLSHIGNTFLESELTYTFPTGTGFGSTPANNSAFGQNRPAFGASNPTTSGGGLFGGGTATAGTSGGFGGFGANTNNTTSSGGLFGQNAQKPAFGSGNTGSGLFGNTGGGFGQTNTQTTGAFGAPVSSALSQNNAECQGTGGTPFSAFTEKEGSSNATNNFQSISFMPPYQKFSFEVRPLKFLKGRILTRSRNYD